LRFFIQCCHPILTERGKGLAGILALAQESGKNAVGDVGELELYDEALKVLFPERQSEMRSAIGKMRVEAVKAKPKDEKLARSCFRSCLKRDDLDHAQQVTTLLYTFHFQMVRTSFRVIQSCIHL